MAAREADLAGEGGMRGGAGNSKVQGAGKGGVDGPYVAYLAVRAALERQGGNAQSTEKGAMPSSDASGGSGVARLAGNEEGRDGRVLVYTKSPAKKKVAPDAAMDSGKGVAPMADMSQQVVCSGEPLNSGSGDRKVGPSFVFGGHGMADELADRGGRLDNLDVMNVDRGIDFLQGGNAVEKSDSTMTELISFEECSQDVRRNAAMKFGGGNLEEGAQFSLGLIIS